MRRRSKPKRFLFAIEGVTGAGKSSIAKELAREMQLNPKKVETLGGYKKIRDLPPVKKAIRKIAKPWMLTLAINFAGGIGVKYATKKKKVAVFTRSPLSAVAYTKINKKMSEEEIRKRADKWIDYYGEKKVDTIFLLDVDEKTAEERVKKREGNLTLKFMHDKEAIEEASRRYKIAADEFRKKGYDIKVIKAGKGITKEEVTERIKKIMEEKMKQNDRSGTERKKEKSEKSKRRWLSFKRTKIKSR